MLNAGELSTVLISRAEAPRLGTLRSRAPHTSYSPKGAGAMLRHQPRVARAANLPPQAISFHLLPLGSKIQFCIDHCEA